MADTVAGVNYPDRRWTGCRMLVVSDLLRELKRCDTGALRGQERGATPDGVAISR